MKNKVLVLIVLAMLVNVELLHAVKPRENQFSYLPLDVKKVIGTMLASGGSAKDVVNYFSLNKQLRNVWQDQRYVNSLMSLIASRYHEDTKNVGDFLKIEKMMPNLPTVKKTIADYKELQKAIAEKNVALIKKYIDENIIPIAEFYNAAIEGDSKKVQLLLDAGINPDLQIYNGYSILSRAVSNNKNDIVKILLQAGADPNLKSDKGLTALDAAFRNNEETVRLLIAAGANVNTQDSLEGRTPLIKAVNNDIISVVKILLDAGADPKIKDKHGDTAIDYYKQLQAPNPEIGKLLEEHMRVQ